MKAFRVSEDLPDQTAFLFVADCVADVELMRHFQFPDAFNGKLALLGLMQAEQEQLPLKNGRPYQFQVTAYNEEGEVLGDARHQSTLLSIK